MTIDTSDFSLVTQRSQSSVRRDATAPVENPVSLITSHETAKSGRVSSVVYFDDEKLVVTEDGVSVPSNIRTQFKISYDPTSGRNDIETVLARQLVLINTFLAYAPYMDKLLNQEH